MRFENQPAKAMTYFELGLAIRERLEQEHPEVPGYANALGDLLYNMALVDLAEGRFGAAEEKLKRAINSQKKALANTPDHPKYRGCLMNALTELIKAANGLGDLAKAADAQRELEKLRDSAR
jgi:tetratricopeptide (TPR) repeat protein